MPIHNGLLPLEPKWLIHTAVITGPTSPGNVFHNRFMIIYLGQGTTPIYMTSFSLSIRGYNYRGSIAFQSFFHRTENVFLGKSQFQ